MADPNNDRRFHVTENLGEPTEDAHHVDAEPTPGMQAQAPAGSHAADPAAHVPARTVRPLKAVGMVGYTLLVVAFALLGLTLVAAASDMAPAPWIVATAVCAVLSLGCLAGSRMILSSRAGNDRAQHDPIMPEVTAEESAEYEHGRNRADGRRRPRTAG